MTIVSVSFYDIIDRFLKEGDKLYFKKHYATFQDGMLRYKNKYFSNSFEFAAYIKKLIKLDCHVHMKSFKIHNGSRSSVCIKTMFFGEGTEVLYGGEIGVFHQGDIYWSDKVFNSLDKFVKCIYHLSCYEKYSMIHECELYIRLPNMQEFEKW